MKRNSSRTKPVVRADTIGFTHPVITMEAVVDVPTFDGPPPWPVGSAGSGTWLRLTAGCGDDRVGLFMATLADGLDIPASDDRDQVMDALLAEESLIVAGGLRIADSTTGMVVVPGCCAGLEDWRDWAQVLTGGTPWLGHDPDPQIEIVDGGLRVWQDDTPSRHRGHRAEVHVDLPQGALPELLVNVQRDLTGFLDALAGWAARTGLGRQAIALVESVDHSLAITAPWRPPMISRTG